jgi:hypothetical protein
MAVLANQGTSKTNSIFCKAKLTICNLNNTAAESSIQKTIGKR